VRTKCARFPSQRALNLAMRGPIFALDNRAAQHLASLTVTLLACTGVPLLLPLSAAAFALAYWVELVGFADVYIKPPYLSSAVPRAMFRVQAVLAIAHCFAAMFFLSGPLVTQLLLYVAAAGRGGSASASGAFALIGGDLGTQTAVHLLVVIVVFAQLNRGALQWLIARAACWTSTRVCFSAWLHKALTAVPPAAQQLTQWETEESAALDHLRASYRDALRVGILLDIPSYDIRENPEFFAAFGVVVSTRKVVDYVAPDPGPGERVVTGLPDGDPATDSAALAHAREINSYDTLLKMVPSNAVRTALYGNSLGEDEAVIVKPKAQPIIGEGRSGFVFKRMARVHLGDEAELKDGRRVGDA